MGRKILFILVSALISFAAFSHLTFAEEPGYILISSKGLPHVNTVLRRSIKTLFANARETYLEHNSAGAEKYIKELDIEFVPFVIYDDSIAATDRFSHMVRHKMIEEVKGYYVIPGGQLRMSEIMLLGRKREPGRLDIFVRGFCPYSRQAQARLINFIRQNKLDININLRYLVNIREGRISSFYGPNEVKEGARQIIIQKYYPGKFLDYLLLAQDKNTEEALEELGIPLKDIDSKEEEASRLLKEDFEESKTLNIKHSPAFLWENLYLIPTLGGLKQHKPFNIRKVRAAGKRILSGPIPIDFFHSEGCRPCLRIKQQFLPQIEAEYKDKIAINYHNIAETDALELKLTLEKEYGILKGSIPEIFLPTVALEGADAIRKDLADAIEEILAQSAPDAAEKIIPEQGPILDKFFTFSPAVIAFAGLADGINPCAFAAMVFFVSFLAINNYGKKQIAYLGGAFILSVFLTYLALGLGIFHVFRKLQLFSFASQLIYYAIAFLALGLGIYSLRDYITYKRTGETKGCSLRWYNRLRSLADNRRGLIILIILAFINGFIIALLESACTGQIYFPTIAFVMKVPSLRLHAFLYLVLYNSLFIVPLVAIFLLACKGTSSEKFALFQKRHLGGIKLTYALLFFGLATLLFVL